MVTIREFLEHCKEFSDNYDESNFDKNVFRQEFLNDLKQTYPDIAHDLSISTGVNFHVEYKRQTLGKVDFVKTYEPDGWKLGHGFKNAIVLVDDRSVYEAAKTIAEDNKTKKIADLMNQISIIQNRISILNDNYDAEWGTEAEIEEDYEEDL